MKKDKRKKTDLEGENANALNDEELSLIKKSVDSDRAQRRRLGHYDNSDKAKLVRWARANKPFAAVCAVLTVCLAAILVLTGIFIAKKVAAMENTDDFTVILGDGKYTEKTKYIAPYKDVMRNGVLYVDMYRLADYAGLTVSGSSSRLKFTASENNYLRFENESEEAVINGSMVDLGGIAAVNESVCYVPYDFLTKAVGNALRFSLDRETNTIKIERRVTATEDKDVFEPMDILFHTDAFTVLMGIVPISKDEEYVYGINIEPYLSAISPENAQEYLILANKQNPLGRDYEPSDLKKIDSKLCAQKEMYLRSDAYTALYAMMSEMQKDGISDTFVTSAYRSYSRQAALFSGYTAEEMKTISSDAIRYFGEEYIYEHYTSKGITALSEEDAAAVALSYSAREGTSEHQTGLCVDFMTTSMTALDETFENSAAFDWLSENAYKYGYILRYPESKTDTTGYKYEPWHYRFVGREAATEIYRSGLCLEEYLSLN